MGALRPGDPEVPKMLARLHHTMKAPNRAMQVLEEHMEAHPGGSMRLAGWSSWLE